MQQTTHYYRHNPAETGEAATPGSAPEGDRATAAEGDAAEGDTVAAAGAVEGCPGTGATAAAEAAAGAGASAEFGSAPKTWTGTPRSMADTPSSASTRMRCGRERGALRWGVRDS